MSRASNGVGKAMKVELANRKKNKKQKTLKNKKEYGCERFTGRGRGSGSTSLPCKIRKQKRKQRSPLVGRGSA